MMSQNILTVASFKKFVLKEILRISNQCLHVIGIMVVCQAKRMVTLKRRIKNEMRLISSRLILSNRN